MLLAVAAVALPRGAGRQDAPPSRDEYAGTPAAEVAQEPPSPATPESYDNASIPLGYYVGRSEPPPALAPPPATAVPHEAPFGASDTPGTVWANAPDGRSIELRGGETYPAGPEVGRIPDGAEVRVYGACLYGDEVDGVWGHWCSVEHGGRRGWAFSPFLTDSPQN